MDTNNLWSSKNRSWFSDGLNSKPKIQPIDNTERRQPWDVWVYLLLRPHICPRHRWVFIALFYNLSGFIQSFLSRNLSSVQMYADVHSNKKVYFVSLVLAYGALITTDIKKQTIKRVINSIYY